mmetsp:Transcript_21413/g.35436  ORF Transcript_21413/g.35436 Transcript_21413/m.35436 type:complete len:201 (+) Transcript_21413:1748-2350(+)
MNALPQDGNEFNLLSVDALNINLNDTPVGKNCEISPTFEGNLNLFILEQNWHGSLEGRFHFGGTHLLGIVTKPIDNVTCCGLFLVHIGWCRINCILLAHHRCLGHGNLCRHELLQLINIHISSRKINAGIPNTSRPHFDGDITIKLAGCLDTKGLNGFVGNALIVLALAANSFAVLDEDAMACKIFLVATLPTSILEGQD